MLIRYRLSVHIKYTLGDKYMKVTALEIRKCMPEIISALERNEEVTLSYRGKDKAVIRPITSGKKTSLNNHPALGMWKDRDELDNVDAYIRNLRKGRHDNL